MSTPAHILVVEDEKDISEIIEIQLSRAGYRVSVIGDGQEALDFIQRTESSGSENDLPPPHLYMLDLMLPNISGLDICKFLRNYKPTRKHPILLVTALTSSEQIVEGLDAGADDYITKPFNVDVLMARVRSLLRRIQHISEKKADGEKNIFTLNELKLDVEQYKTWLRGEELDLTPSEFKMLHTFLQQPGKVLTRNQLVESMQGGEIHVSSRTVDTHVFGLRKKLKDYAQTIETIRGIGYRVVPHI